MKLEVYDRYYNVMYFTCDIRSASYPYKLAAPSPPSILENPENSIIASVGQTVTFTCSATGEPSPTISWTFNNVTLPPVMFETNDGVSVLTITDIQTTDIGIYRCTASNSQGSATSGSASLQLACKYCVRGFLSVGNVTIA